MRTKRFLIGLLLVMIATTSFSFPKPRFFITTQAKGDDKGLLSATSYLPRFESEVMKDLKKMFPCVETNIASGIAALISWDRQRQLLSTSNGSDNYLENIAGALGCDYLICLKVNVFNNMTTISAACLDIRKVDAIAHAFETAPHGDAALDALEKAAQNLIDDIARYEICPFKGKVQVKVISNLEKNEEEEYGVYCNQKDEMYRKETTINNHSEKDWLLEKTGLKSGKGTVNYNISEEFSLVEENGCFRCKSGREGGRTLRERTTTKGKIEGLSNESTQDGLPVDDARISLKFMDDGTYTMVVKAASKKGDLTLINEAHSVGTCDLVNVAPKPIQKKADIGIRDMTFGPFNGTAKEKILSDSQVINETDPISEEENQYSIEFNLKRD